MSRERRQNPYEKDIKIPMSPVGPILVQSWYIEILQKYV